MAGTVFWRRFHDLRTGADSCLRANFSRSGPSNQTGSEVLSLSKGVSSQNVP